MIKYWLDADDICEKVEEKAGAFSLWTCNQ